MLSLVSHVIMHRLGKNKLHELRGVKFFCQICEIVCQIWILEPAN